jgi:hypothetical protein
VIDTPDKRRSATFSLATTVFPLVDGAVDIGDRAQESYCYRLWSAIPGWVVGNAKLAAAFVSIPVVVANYVGAYFVGEGYKVMIYLSDDGGGQGQ